MINVTRILCPVDFSEHAGRAFASACAAGRWYGAPVTALHVVTLWPAVDVVPSLGVVTPPVEVADGNLNQIQALLDGFVARHRPTDVHVDAVVREAPDVHREILAVAEASGVDLIVMGTHGRSGFEHLLLGSVTEKVLRKATCPVMAIPLPVLGATARTAPHFRRILCPIDFSDGARAALAYALSLGEDKDAHVTLLNVIEPAPDAADGVASIDTPAPARHAEMVAGRLQRLRELVPSAARECCWVETTIEDGRASREIVRVAAERDCDLIVMGAHGRGALDLLVFGSNTHAVIRAGVAPVLTVPATAVPA